MWHQKHMNSLNIVKYTMFKGVLLVAITKWILKSTSTEIVILF